MDEILKAILTIGAISSARQDDTVSRQLTANFGSSSHLMTLNFARDAVEPSTMESFAAQGVAGMWGNMGK